jgi:transposase InsO family protein
MAMAPEDQKATLWHRRLGHISEKGLQVMSNQKLLGKDKISKVDFCEHCVLAKQHRLKFQVGKHQSTQVLEYIHSDLWGPSRTATHGGNLYFLSIIDDFSRKVWVYLLKNKNQAFKKFKEWKLLMENLTDKKVKTLRTDNGLEFCNSEFDTFCTREGIQRHKTVRLTPQQNGVAKRMNRTLLNKARSMLFNAGLSKAFWGEAIVAAAYLINRCPSSAIEFKTPEEKWSNKPPDLQHLRVFGCTAFAHQNQGKLESRSIKCVFLGYPQGTKGYRLWIKDGSGFKTMNSRDVVFNEFDFPCIVETNPLAGQERPTSTTTDYIESLNQVEPVRSTSPQPQQSATSEAPTERCEDQEGTPVQEFAEATSDPDEDGNNPEDHEDSHEPSESPQELEDYQLTRDRSKRVSKPTQIYGYSSYSELMAYAFTSDVVVNLQEPMFYQEAMSSQDSKRWHQAMKEEMEALYRNQTWLVVKRPKEQKPVACRWLYKLKEPIVPGEAPRYKARLVAKGFTQVDGIDYNEIFSPVVKYKTIRVMLSLVTQFDLELQQMDVKIAFLHGELEETIYMEQPLGFEVHEGKDMVCLLKKSLYGLKQSPRQWYKRFDSYMLKQGYQRSSFDSCLYFKGSNILEDVYLLLYVDDMLLISKSTKKISVLKHVLSKEFDMKDLGDARKILGINILRDRENGRLLLTQQDYLDKVVEKFSMRGSKPVRQPLASHFKLSSSQSPKTASDQEYMSEVPYPSVVGSVMYTMVCIRPDIAHAISVLSRFMSKPGREHWLAMKWLLRYLCSTTNLGLVYRQQGEKVEVEGYLDSDYAGDHDTRKSTTAYFFLVCGNCVSWKSQLQPVVTLSTAEAEYIAATEAIKEGIWLQGMLKELEIYNETVTVFSDSQSALHLCKNPVFHDRMKHVDIKYHFIREKIADGIVKV